MSKKINKFKHADKIFILKKPVICYLTKTLNEYIYKCPYFILEGRGSTEDKAFLDLNENFYADYVEIALLEDALLLNKAKGIKRKILNNIKEIKKKSGK